MRTFALICIAASSLQLLLIVGGVTSAPAHEHATLLLADQCDWTGSGGGGRGVRPVYLRCSRGTVSWRYPRGALRVVLSLGAGTGVEGSINRSEPQGFRACVKVSGPVRVYLETSGTLRPVYSPRDGKHEACHRCFHSRKQMAALFIEADELSYGQNKVKLQYDLETNVERGKVPGELDEEAECRPCSMDELAKAYCQSDLVARGTVSAVQRKPDLEAAELVLRVTKTLRRVEEAGMGNEVDFDIPHEQRDVRVRVPAACDARHGQGEFVIMAKRRLGDLTLVCAPRLEAWAEAVRELESAPCVLTS